MDQINFRGKDGKTKYIADSKGHIKQVDKDGKMRDIQLGNGKAEEVEITPEDLKES